MRRELLRIENLNKSFFGLQVLKDVTLNLFEGEILGLTGLNNSGKSTLVNILTGIHKKDSGTIYFDEQEVNLNSRDEAEALGIYCIQHDLKLMPNLTIAENLFVVRHNNYKKLIVDKDHIATLTRELLSRVGLNMAPETLAASLSIGEQHMVNIAKALSYNARLIIIDDIVNLYSEKDLEILKTVMSQLRASGKSIIFVNHKLDEMLDITDRLVILRKGQSVKTLYKEEYATVKLAGVLVGHEFSDTYVKSVPHSEEIILKIEHLSTRNHLRDINLTLKKGEILSLIDLEGDASDALISVLYGLSPRLTGTIWINGKKVLLRNIREAVKHGIGMIPTSISKSLFMDMSIAENAIFMLNKKISNRLGYINPRMQRFAVRESYAFLGITKNEDTQCVAALSRDEQFRVIMCKWLLIKPHVLIIDKPSLGVDIVFKKAIYAMMDEACRQGVAIILVPSDISEILDISDRALFLQEGKVKSEFSGRELSKPEFLDLIF